MRALVSLSAHKLIIPERWSSRFGPASLLIWWVFAPLTWLGHVVIAEQFVVGSTYSSWRPPAALLVLLFMAGLLFVLNVRLLSAPKRMSTKMVSFMVAAMLCQARAAPRVLEALDVEAASQRSAWLLPHEHLCQGPLPLLYVLLISRLPADPVAAIGVAAAYVVVSAAVAIRGSFPQKLPSEVKPWIDATLLLAFAVLVVLRRQCPVHMSRPVGSPFTKMDANLLAWRQWFGPLTFFFWWSTIVYGFVDMILCSTALTTEALTDDKPLHVESFTVGGLAALACLLCILTMGLVLAPQQSELLHIETPLAASVLLFSGGLHLGSPWLPELPTSMDVFSALQKGPLPIAHILLISQVPRESAGVIAVASVYIVLEGVNQVVAATRSDQEMLADALAEWAVTAACAGLAAARSCSAAPAKTPALVPVARHSPPRSPVSCGLRQLPRLPGLGQEGWLLPPMPAGEAFRDAEADAGGVLAGARASDAAEAAAPSSPNVHSPASRRTRARAPRHSPRRSPRGLQHLSPRVVPEEPEALLPTTYGLIYAGGISEHAPKHEEVHEPELEPSSPAVQPWHWALDLTEQSSAPRPGVSPSAGRDRSVLASETSSGNSKRKVRHEVEGKGLLALASAIRQHRHVTTLPERRTNPSGDDPIQQQQWIVSRLMRLPEESRGTDLSSKDQLPKVERAEAGDSDALAYPELGSDFRRVRGIVRGEEQGCQDQCFEGLSCGQVGETYV